MANNFCPLWFNGDSLEEGQDYNKYDCFTLKLQILKIHNYDAEYIVSSLKNKGVDLKGKTIAIELLNYDEGYLNDEEIKNLISFRSKLQKEGADLKFNEGRLFSIEEVLKTNEKINELVNEINSATVQENGVERPLNELEKFIWVYKFVTNRKYIKESEQDSPELSRTLTNIFSSSNIVCVGFDRMLREICGRLGIKCLPNKCLPIKDENEKISRFKLTHQNTVVFLDGAPYYCDSCWDSRGTENTEPTFAYCLIPFKDVKQLKSVKIKNSQNYLLSYDDLDEVMDFANQLTESPDKAQELCYKFRRSRLFEKCRQYFDGNSMKEIFNEHIIENESPNFNCKDRELQKLEILLKLNLTLDEREQVYSFYDKLKNKDTFTEEELKQERENGNPVFKIYKKYESVANCYYLLETFIVQLIKLTGADIERDYTKFFDSLKNVYISQGMSEEEANIKLKQDMETTILKMKKAYTKNAYILAVWCSEYENRFGHTIDV